MSVKLQMSHAASYIVCADTDHPSCFMCVCFLCAFFPSQPEALSQLDTSQSELMVLDADLWIVRERGDHCTSNECIYKV